MLSVCTWDTLPAPHTPLPRLRHRVLTRTRHEYRWGEGNAQIDELGDARLGLSRSLAPLTRPRFSVRAPPPVASIALVDWCPLAWFVHRPPSVLRVGSRKTRQQETHNKTSTDNKKSTTSRHAQQSRHARQPLYTASHSTRCFTQPESAASAADRVRRQPRRWSWSRSASCVTGAPNRIG